jgi:hypothetical protein
MDKKTAQAIAQEALDLNDNEFAVNSNFMWKYQGWDPVRARNTLAALLIVLHKRGYIKEPSDGK